MASLSLLTRDEGRRLNDEPEAPFSCCTFNLADGLRTLDALMPTLEKAESVAVVSSFRVHLGDASAAAAEAEVLARMKHLSAPVVVFRAGHILGTASRTTIWLRRFGFAYPLVPARMRSCFVTDAELSTAIELEKRRTGPRRPVTILGPNRSWKDVLREHRTSGIWSAILTGICYFLSLLLIGHIAAMILDLLAYWRPSLRQWNCDTLRPTSFTELLALYNPHNFRYVKIVGYNNGVVHFGHRYPGRTVVSTVHCNRIVRTSKDVIKADCGATIRRATDILATDGQELFVLPNYSYVCLGTAFYVPIHGSAADYTTVAETFVKALLYDPMQDRFILATSDDPRFRENVYNFASPMLVLRLWMRVKPKATYFAHTQELENADSDQIVEALRDTRATNVEIRKSAAGSNKIQLTKYYKSLTETTAPALEMPRDSLGRLWDRLEENAVTSFLMHALTRWLAWHVELFFTPEEFAVFWRTHQALPLKKIQLRYIRRDGLPNSPFCENDCVSADMFMFRWNRGVFEAYLKRTFAIVRSNPGKHSE